jgi:LEA14-like dessication related protein
MNLTRLFGLISILMVGLASCKKISDPEFRRVEHFRLKNFGLQETTVGFEVTYFNPNNFGVSVKETGADIYIDSTYLGKFTQDSAVNVSSHAEFSIPLSGTIPLQKALQMNFQNIATRNILLRAEGSVKIGKAGFYVTKPIHYQGYHTLDEIKF